MLDLRLLSERSSRHLLCRFRSDGEVGQLTSLLDVQTRRKEQVLVFAEVSLTFVAFKRRRHRGMVNLTLSERLFDRRSEVVLLHGDLTRSIGATMVFDIFTGLVVLRIFTTFLYTQYNALVFVAHYVPFSIDIVLTCKLLTT